MDRLEDVTEDLSILNNNLENSVTDLSKAVADYTGRAFKVHKFRSLLPNENETNHVVLLQIYMTTLMLI